MHEILVLCLGLVLSVSFLVLLANKLKIPYPIFLVVAGLLISLLPWIPSIHIDPNVVFIVVLPPILFDAAFQTSWKSLWRWRRIVSVMALGYVMLTATVVAFISHWIIPGFSLAQGFLLGAIISPPDAAAAASVLQYVKLPKTMVSIIEGESLLNDATSLTLFRFALAAIVTSKFVWYEAAGGFLLVVVSGIAIGLAFGFLFYAIYKWLPTTANLNIALSFVLPYLMYDTAERFHSSGVLAVVAGSLFISYQDHFIFSHTSRLRANAIWPAIVFIINAVIFFLIGLQLPDILRGVQSLSVMSAIWIALIITAALILVRMLSSIASSYFTVFISRYITVAYAKPGLRNPLVLGWIGMRGVVSLASAFSLPLLLPGGANFPNRNLILFITFVVIIVTLVVQGLSLPWVIRWIKPRSFPGKTDEQQILEIETQLLTAAVAEISNKYPKDIADNPLLKSKHELLKYKTNLYKNADDDDKRSAAIQIINRFKVVMTRILEHQRSELHQFRTKDEYDDDVIKTIEHRIDLEEERLEENTE